jgi:hypothetical protein
MSQTAKPRWRATFRGMRNHWQDWVSSLVGIWVFVTPWALPWFFPESAASGTVAWNHYIVGLMIVGLSVAALTAYNDEWEGWVDAIAGLWLIGSPWILGFTSMKALTWNAIIKGASTVVLSELNFYEGDNDCVV